jgi:hypothetical protein
MFTNELDNTFVQANHKTPGHRDWTIPRITTAAVQYNIKFLIFQIEK